MNSTLPTGQCATEWCDQGDRPHTRHEATAGTWFAEGWTKRGGQTVQLVVHGWEDADAAPMLALVDREHRQVDAVMEWDDAHELAATIIEWHRRMRRLSAPQD